MIQHALALPVDFLVLLGKGILRVQWPGHLVLLDSRADHLASDDWQDSSLVSPSSWDPLNSIKSRLVSLSPCPLNRTHQRTPLTAHNKDPDAPGPEAGTALLKTCSYYLPNCDLTLKTSHTQMATLKPLVKLLHFMFFPGFFRICLGDLQHQAHLFNFKPT